MKLNRAHFNNMLIDCHTHCEGIDVFNFIHGYTPAAIDTVGLLHVLSLSKIDCAVTFPMPTTMYYNPMTYENRVYANTNLMEFPYELENLRMLSIVKKCGLDKLMPFVAISLNKKIQEQIQAIREWQRRYMIYGIKYHTQTDGHRATEIGTYASIIELIRSFDYPIIFHTGNTDVASPLYALEFAKEFPDIRICIAHMGRFRTDFFKRYFSGNYPNVYFDVAPYDFLYVTMNEAVAQDDNPLRACLSKDMNKTLKNLYDKFGEKLMWGSDYPYISSQYILGDDSGSDFIAYHDVVCTLLAQSDVVIGKIANDNVLSFVFSAKRGEV